LPLDRFSNICSNYLLVCNDRSKLKASGTNKEERNRVFYENTWWQPADSAKNPVSAGPNLQMLDDFY